jgi:lysozyme
LDEEITVTQHLDELAMDIYTILEFEEGLSLTPYLCSRGYVTIGLGTKLHKSKGLDPNDFPISISRKMAVEWLYSEVALKNERLVNMFGSDYTNLSPDRQAIIMSMAYQLGTTGVSMFKNMWVYLSVDHFQNAAMEMLDSRWAKQTPERAKRHKRVMDGEALDYVYGAWL